MWKGEVDDLLVLVNGPHPVYVLEEIQRVAEQAGGKFLYFSAQLGHGLALLSLLQETASDGMCPADEVMLVEDDAYVRLPGAVAEAFMRIPEGGVIGSPRGGYDPAVGVAANEKWGPDPTCPDGWYGFGLWPCFLFGARETLEPAAYGFPSLSHSGGSTIPGVGLVVPEGQEYTTDTCTLAALILRANGPIEAEGQWKELWLKNLDERREHCGYDPPWFHSGGLSNAMVHAGPPIGGTNAGLDCSHRLWWRRRCVQTAPEDFLPELAAQHLALFDRYVADAGIEAEVATWDDTLEPWITWPE